MQENTNDQSLLITLDNAINALDSEMKSFSVVLGDASYAWNNRDQWLDLSDVWRSSGLVQSLNPGFLDRLCEETHTNTFFFTCFLKRSFLRIIYLDRLMRSLESLKESVVEFQEVALGLSQQRAWVESNTDYISLMISNKDFSSAQEIHAVYNNIAVAKNKTFSMINTLLERKASVQDKIYQLVGQIQIIRRSLFLNCFDRLGPILTQIEGVASNAKTWLISSQKPLKEPSFSSSLFYFQCNVMKIFAVLKQYMNQLSIRRFLQRKNSDFFPVKDSFTSLYELTCGLLREDELKRSEANQVYNEMQAYSGIYANDDVGRIIESAQLYQDDDLLHLRDMFMPELPISQAIHSLDRGDLRFSSFKYVLVIFLYSFLHQVIKNIGVDYTQNKKIYTQDHLPVELVACALLKMNSLPIFEGDFIIKLFHYTNSICTAFKNAQVYLPDVPTMQVVEEKEGFLNGAPSGLAAL